MTTLRPPMCVGCKHLFLLDLGRSDTSGYTCKAFPDGIPQPILRNEHDHRKPFKGDDGVRYEPAWPNAYDPFA